ncbi:Polynucleotide 5'-hydroxyl-kinase grc3 [Tulasnella sp. 427]|nr:Polynucleotide 5'-hydroxyl-kinase grc3 [Tulasnella sp. 427]
MLSAVAARKAAKQAEQEAKAAQKAAEEAVRQDANPKQPGSQPKQSARALEKSTTASTPSENSKKRKGKKEREEDEDLTTASSPKSQNPPNGSTPRVAQESSISEAVSSEPAKKKVKRAWSPSQLLASAEDESDDGNENSDDDPVLDLGLLVPGDASDERPLQVNAPTSVFKPVVGQNVFPPSSIKSCSSTGTFAIVKWGQDESIVFTGAVKLTLIAGYLSLLGTEIRPQEPHLIFAPTFGPLPTLRHSRSQYPVVSTEINLNALKALPKEVRDKWRMGDTVIRLENLSETGVQGLGEVVGNCDGMFAGGNWEAPNPDLGVDGFHLVLRPDTRLHSFSPPTQWIDAINQVVDLEPKKAQLHATRTVTLVKGPGRSGKSTFARTMLNRMLSRYEKVAYLDCDIGQSEFGPGGTVGLYLLSEPQFGPPFTHPKQPFAAHYIGSTSPRSNPSHYISAIASLLQTFATELQFGAIANETTDDTSPQSHRSPPRRISAIVPVIINTHGWVKGMGADLARRIEELAQPTYIFELLPRPSDREMDLYGFEGGPSGRSAGERVLLNEIPGATVWGEDPVGGFGVNTNEPPKIFQLPPGPLPGQVTNAIKAEDLRDLTLMSYFHYRFDSETWKTDVALSAALPYEVNATEAFDAIILTGSGAEDVGDDELAAVLNGSLVALVEADDPRAVLPASESLMIPYVQGSLPPDPNTSRCLGLGFVRACTFSSPTSLQLQIVTPLSPTEIARCRILVKGEMEMPIWASVGSSSSNEGREWKNGRLLGTNWENTPYLAYRRTQGTGPGRNPSVATAVGGDVKKGRKNVKRAGQA